MKTASEKILSEFLEDLSSKEPVPGGGGACALIGAVGLSLCSMVANLTSGKKKYAAFQADIDVAISRTTKSIMKLQSFITKDAEVFQPLSEAYRISKDNPNREIILENALVTACSVPMGILKEVAEMMDVVELLSEKGTTLAISDIGVAAASCRAAMEGAIMNVYINTGLMKNRDDAIVLNKEAETILQEGITRCNRIYKQISDNLRIV